jgi:hypothetical protein
LKTPLYNLCTNCENNFDVLAKEIATGKRKENYNVSKDSEDYVSDEERMEGVCFFLFFLFFINFKI